VNGNAFARLALAAGALAFVLRVAPRAGVDGAPAALAWPVAIAGIGLWVAAFVEQRRGGGKVSSPVLWAGAALLAVALVTR